MLVLPLRQSVKEVNSPDSGSGSRWQRLARFSLGLALAGIVGCLERAPGGFNQPAGPVEKEVPMATVVGRVNENSARMDFVLRGVGTVEGRYLKADGRLAPFHETAKLLFHKPRSLALVFEHTLGENVMEIGSNDTEFWVWKKPGDNRYWWGRYDQLEPEAEADLPIRPDHLVEVIGLGNLPTVANPQHGPLFEVLADRYQLTFLAARPGGLTYPVKRVLIDRRPPYLVRELVYLNPNGRTTCTAKLSEYSQIGGASALVPHHIRLDWPLRGEILELDLPTMERHQGRDPSKYFLSPLQRGKDVGEEIRVDRKAVPEAVPGRS